MTPSDIDPDEVENMLAEIREHLLADHVVRVTSQSEITEVLASAMAVMRTTANALDAYALVLRRVPDTAASIAGELEASARLLRTTGVVA